MQPATGSEDWLIEGANWSQVYSTDNSIGVGYGIVLPLYLDLIRLVTSGSEDLACRIEDAIAIMHVHRLTGQAGYQRRGRSASPGNSRTLCNGVTLEGSVLYNAFFFLPRIFRFRVNAESQGVTDWHC